MFNASAPHLSGRPIRPLASRTVPDYRGLSAIAERMGVHVDTIREWHRTKGFLMYPRRFGPRTVWVTNDQLILTWEIAQSHQAQGRKLNPHVLPKTSRPR